MCGSQEIIQVSLMKHHKGGGDKKKHHSQNGADGSGGHGFAKGHVFPGHEIYLCKTTTGGKGGNV